MAEQPMLKFVKIDRDMPSKREAKIRREDFNEIYAEYAGAKAEEQASRCSQCGVPYCQSHCPLHNGSYCDSAGTSGVNCSVSSVMMRHHPCVRERRPYELRLETSVNLHLISLHNLSFP